MSSISQNGPEAELPPKLGAAGSAAPESGRNIPEVAGDENLSPWALLVVLIFVAAGVVLVAMHHWRRGSVMIGGAVGLAALLRLLLPTRLAGLLVVRSKSFDVISCGLIGAAIMILGMIVPGGFDA